MPGNPETSVVGGSMSTGASDGAARYETPQSVLSETEQPQRLACTTLPPYDNHRGTHVHDHELPFSATGQDATFGVAHAALAAARVLHPSSSSRSILTDNVSTTPSTTSMIQNSPRVLHAGSNEAESLLAIVASGPCSQTWDIERAVSFDTLMVLLTAY